MQGELTNILIVDDEPANLLVLETVLEDPGYRLVRAQSADQALRALMADEFAVMVLDIQLPDMNGIELARAVRERYPGIKIILASGYPQPAINGESMGEFSFVGKPYRLADLARQLRSA